MLALAMKLSSLLLSGLTGVLLVLSFPPFDWFPLGWMAFLPLLLVLENKTRREAAFLVFLSMFVFFLELLRWLSVFGWVAWVASSVVQAFYPALWGYFSHDFIAGKHGSFLRVFFPSLSYVAMEALRNLGSFGMPWGDLAYSQWLFLPMVQVASLSGALGISFLLILFNLLLFAGWRERKPAFHAAACFCLLVPLAFGTFRLREPGPSVGRVRVAALQTNDMQMQKWDEARQEAMMREMDRLVARAAKEKPELVLFPETALAGILADSPFLRERVRRWARLTRSHLAVGTLWRSGDRPQNAVALVTPDGGWKEVYAKVRLVPFGEYLPAPFRSLRGRLRVLDLVPNPDYRPGDRFRVFDLNGKRLGIMICFESSFGWIARELVRNGAEFLAVSTNDAWFVGTPAQEEHAAMAVFRAVETGRSCVQAGNTGISCLVDPRGRRVGWELPGRAAVVAGEIPVGKGLTLYAWIGDAFSTLAMALTAVLWGWKELGRHEGKLQA